MQPKRVLLEPTDVEYWPVDKLQSLQEKRLLESRVLARAAVSSLYAGRWPRIVGPAGREVLQSLPFTNGPDLLAVEQGRRLAGLAVTPPCLWVSSASVSGRKWIPCAPQDLLRSVGVLARLMRVLELRPEEAMLFVTPPAPLFQNALPYLWAHADRWAVGLRLELIVGSMAMAEHNNWPEFAARREPATLVARPSDAQALKERFRRAGKGSIRRALPRLSRGLFYGEALQPYRSQLQRAYGLEAFGCYASAEFPCYACECPAHQGLHVWLDLAVPEIIPNDELQRASRQPGLQPRGLFLEEAPAGAEGELVVTTFSLALPMVRYRTGDRVRVLGTHPCACGRTHPRIEVLGRL